jgi:hypothetical protein
MTTRSSRPRVQFPVYERTPGQTRLAGLPGAEWGQFTRYLEIAADRYATRQVDCFENGYALRYDRTHYMDEFGTLADMRYSAKWQRWWPNTEAISEEEFERIWVAATESAGHELQRSDANANPWPEPPWLTRKRRRA